MTRKNFRFLKLASVVVVGGALIWVSAQSVGAQEMGAGGRMISGKGQYQTHCAQCHGMEGKGDGPVAAALKTQPADLTMLAKNNGGVYPEEKVVDSIKANSPIQAHAALAVQMRQSSESGTGATFTGQQIQKKIKLVADYIKTLQAK
jgi:mono/diheme cytochrome c family protein